MFGRNEKNKSVTLQCDNEGTIGRVVSNDTSDVKFSEITEISQHTKEITLIGHSSDYYLKDDRNFASMNPKNLAQSISSLYKGDKNKLEKIRLVSCEVGLSVNGRCFAQDFLAEMQKLGFNNLTVHAFNPPKLDEPATGMVVETYQNNTMVNAWVYRRKSDEDVDKRLETLLKECESKLKTVNNPSEENKLKVMQDKYKEQRRDCRLYICDRTDINTALDLEQNTFEGETQQAKKQMSLDAALAISYLRYQRLDLSPDEKISNYLDDCIISLQRHPNLDKTEISIKLNSKVPTYTLQLTPYTTLIHNVTAYIDKNRTLPPEESIEKAFMDTWQFIKRFIAIFIYTCCKGEAPPEFKKKLDDVKQKIENSNFSPNDKTLRNNAGSSIEDLKQFLIKQINDYIEENYGNNDTTHKNKKNVMINLKEILQTEKLSDAIEKLNKLNNKLSKGKLKFWDKGLASTVAATKSETETYIEQLKIINPPNR